MSNWDRYLAIALFGLAAFMQAIEQAAKDKIVFADLTPIFATAWWNYAPAALLIVAGIVWFFGFLSRTRSPRDSQASKPQLKPLIEAFEMHAAKEHVLSTACGVNHSTAGNIVAATDRDFFRDLLNRMEKAVGDLGLTATRAAIMAAIAHFNTNLNVGTAYAQFRAVTQALKDEIDGPPSPRIPQNRRNVVIGAVVAVAVLLLAFGLLAPEKRVTFALAEDQKQKLEAALSAWPERFRVLIFYNKQNEQSFEYAEKLLVTFRGKDWPAFFNDQAYVGATVFGIKVN